MSFKTILVHVEPNAVSENRVRLAVDVARKFEGRVIGLGAEAFVPVGTTFGYIEGSVAQQLRDDIDTRMRDAEARFKNASQSSDEKATWISAIDSPNHCMALHARGADLIVTSRSEAGSISAVATPGDLVMETGTPVLVAPASKTELDARYVVVAWKDTRECRRALRDALPFLTHASVVHLVQIAEEADTDACKKGLDEICHRLTRHGAQVKTTVLPKSKKSIAKELEEAADRYSAELIVTGAYGHSRLREWVLGGVTQELMDSSSKLIFFSR